MNDDEERWTAAEVHRLAGAPMGNAAFMRANRGGEQERERYLFNFEPVDVPDVEGVWVEVSGGGLLEPVRIRVNRSPDGRFVVTGMLLGATGRQELTSDTLRSIRLSEIMRELFSDFDPSNPPTPDPEDENGYVAWWLFKELVYDRAATVPSLPGSDEAGSLAEFAETYLRCLARQPHRAMTATAELLHISRATANRRAAACRTRGLLPATEDRS